MPPSSHAIVFVCPFDTDTTLVDRATGGHGFGHVAIWGGQVEGSQPVVLDSSIGNGVGFRPMREMTRGVPHVSMWLDERFGAWLFARAMRCIGAEYDYGGLVKTRVRTDAFTCSGLVCCALPVQLEQRCRAQAEHRTIKTVSPNDIARVLGVPKWKPTP